MKPELEHALQAVIKDNSISCRQAHAVAVELNLPPLEVGKAADFLNCRIIRCQLGLFGYQPVKKIVQAQCAPEPDVQQAIEKAAPLNKLDCAHAWEMAQQHQLTRQTLANICEHLQIKFTQCQLGAF